MRRRMAAILGTIAVAAVVLATPAAAGGRSCPAAEVRPWPPVPSPHRPGELQPQRHQPVLPPQARQDAGLHRHQGRREGAGPGRHHLADPGDRRGADPGGRGPAVPGQRPGRADQRLLHPGPLRQRLVLRRGHRRAGPPRPRRQHRGHLACRGRRRPTRRLHAGPPTTRPQVPPGVVRGPGRGRVQGGRAAPRGSACPTARSATPCAPRRPTPWNQTCWTTSTTSGASARSRSCRSRDPGRRSGWSRSSPDRPCGHPRSAGPGHGPPIPAAHHRPGLAQRQIHRRRLLAWEEVRARS